jgi:hypothetical protein
VRLDGERHPDCRAHGSAEEHVIREQIVRRQVIADGGSVLLDEPFPLGLAEILEVPSLEVFVAVEHEDRQRPLYLGTNARRAAEVIGLRTRLLGENDDLVAEPAPGTGERTGVDVRARPAQEVAVPNENLHACTILTHRSSSALSEATSGRSSS